MSRCRHRDRRGHSLVDFHLRDGTLAGPFDGHRLFRGVCPRCGTISLGPANDTPATAVEVLAAWLAVRHRESPFGGVTFTASEMCGWDPSVARSFKLGRPQNLDGYHAGALARAIVDHDKESDRG